jgi:hypothetical protein
MKRARPLLLCVLAALGACTPVGQRTFVANADKPPKPKPARTTAPPPTPALVTIRFPTDEDWHGALSAAVGLARSRKPDVLFTVQMLVPPHGSPADQAASLARAAPDARSVADAIVADGADRSQVELAAATDPAVDGEVVRIYVR